MICVRRPAAARVSARPALAFVLCTLGLVATGWTAVDIEFSSSVNRTNRSAAGLPLTSDYIFELGAFQSGFVPALTNASQWAANWVPLGKAAFMPNATNESASRFARIAILDSNAAPFNVGGSAYIWGYRSSGGPAEWILLRSTNWAWPSAGAGVPYPIATSNPGATAVIGSHVPAAGNPVHMQFAYAPSGVESPKLKAADWRNLVFGSLTNLPSTALDADYDGDGWSNLAEFASNGDARVPGGTPPQEAQILELDGLPYLALKVRKNPSADVTWTIERSTNLATGPWMTDNLLTVTNTPDILIMRWTTPLNTPGLHRLFLRARAVENP